MTSDIVRVSGKERPPPAFNLQRVASLDHGIKANPKGFAVLTKYVIFSWRGVNANPKRLEECGVLK